MSIAELKEELRRRDKQMEEQAARIKELEKEIRELKKLLVEKAQSKESKPPKEASNFSMSALARLSKRMEKFTLGDVLAEIGRWMEAGHSVFQEELASVQAATGS